MAKLTKNDVTVEDGFVIGTVSTNSVGSECEFEVCEAEIFFAMSEDDQQKALVDAAIESGMFEISFKEQVRNNWSFSRKGRRDKLRKERQKSIINI